MERAAALDALDAARVGVFGYVLRSGRPNACAVTPYVVDGAAVVTSTLALIDKAAAVRRDPRVVLLAGGAHVGGQASVGVDTTPAWFDRHLREQEREKYPPARSILGVPLHRHLFWWYVGRVVVSITPERVVDRPGDDVATITVLDGDGVLTTHPIARPDDLTAPRLEVGGSTPDGPAVVLLHEEDEAMNDLRQLTLHGFVDDGAFVVERRRGSLQPGSTGAASQLAEARRLARRAKQNGGRLQRWATLD